MEEEPGSVSKGQRPRLTCTACYRRKIKCDKTIPCGTCIRRGYADLCVREEMVMSADTPSVQPRFEAGISNEAVRLLLDRVSQLESKLGDADSKGQNATISHIADDSAQRSPSVQHEPQDTQDASSPILMTQDSADTATVLEFLAWGRRKDAEYGNASEETGPRLPVCEEQEVTIGSHYIFEGIANSQLDVLETLLPTKRHILELVKYHHNSLVWYHGSYSPAFFERDMTTFLTEYNANIRHSSLNIQWLALFFAILTGSMTCAAPTVRESWGFSESEQAALSLRWYDATVTCLNLSKYMENHSIYSVQAIATLTISAHVIGVSNSQSILLASAGRIAQSLGLHRLESDSTSLSIDQLRRREVGRRVFNQLCTQDWFQIPFAESYSLNPKFFNTSRPLNCNDDDMLCQPQSTPTQASYCNYRYEIALLMPQLLDATADCNTLFTKYEQVLKFDDKMRKLATAYMPTFLSTNAPVAETWPSYIGWARRSLAICAAHKIIMIHRKFLGLSFSNSAFAFTRRTCIAASKTILKEALSTNEGDGPVLWIEQAFTVAAGIILSLDTLHRTAGASELDEHTRLVNEAINYLKRFQNNKIAIRGAQLLSALQQELLVADRTNNRKRRTDEEQHGPSQAQKRIRIFDIDNFVKHISHGLNVTSPSAANEPGPSNGDVEDLEWDNLSTQIGSNLFDDLLSFQF